MPSLKTFVSACLVAVSLGLIAQGLVGYSPFPQGDDFAYAPLAEFRANPDLFPRDEQLRLFANHARVYDWLFALGQNGQGVEPVFRVTIWLLAIAVSAALLCVLSLLGVPSFALPLVLAVGVVVQLDGLGRGDYGGLISPFFHHHNVALTLILGAVAGALAQRYVIAGILLGLAAYAQPMTALHGAVIVGLGVLLVTPRDTLRMALVSGLVAVPAAVLVLGQLPSAASGGSELDLITDAYRFRAPHHYDPAWSSIGVTTLYLAAGWIGAMLLRRSDPKLALLAAGTIGAFTLLHLVTLVVYKGGIAEWAPFFILDANRSSSLLFVLGPLLALAGAWRVGDSSSALSVGLVLAAILLVNGTVEGLVLLALGAVFFALDRFAWGQGARAALAVLAMVLVFPPRPAAPPIPAATRDVLERIRAETPSDALFVIPVALFSFRHYAQRSVYVDFKLFSVAQPDQAALTRQRIDMVASPAPEHRSATGWQAVSLWDADQRARATCDMMRETLEIAGAEYYLRALGPEDVPPECPALPRTISSETLALYGPPS
ncbi:DUF6798 domain-containing protein [Roseobacter sp. A03A-229]